MPCKSPLLHVSPLSSAVSNQLFRLSKSEKEEMGVQGAELLVGPASGGVCDSRWRGKGTT